MYINTNFMNDFIMSAIEGDELDAQWIVTVAFGRNMFGLRDSDMYYV